MSKPSPEDYDAAIRGVLLSAAEVARPAVGGTSMPAVLNHADPVLEKVRNLLALGCGGILLRGVPGTGKTWYARRLAASLVGSAADDIFFAQFHPSYGYEDFVEGYRPDSGSASGFAVVPKLFIQACRRAEEVHGLVVLVIDEINRGDPARVFGEVLTYIERSYRGQSFTLPFSGAAFSVPPNLLIIGTLNPHDRSISHLDLAFVRRFDHLDLHPSADTLRHILSESGGFDSRSLDRVIRWFEDLQRLVPMGLGHAYLKDARRPEDLALIWEYRVRPVCEQALEFDQRRQSDLSASFEAMYRDVAGQAEP